MSRTQQKPEVSFARPIKISFLLADVNEKAIKQIKIYNSTTKNR